MRGGWIVIGLAACSRTPDGVSRSPGAAIDEPDSDLDTAAGPSCPVPWTPEPPDLGRCVAHWTRDDADDGTVGSQGDETYDDDGRKSSADFGASGPIAHSEWDYDGSDRVIEQRTDFESDGVFDVRTVSAYDGSGYVVETVTWYDGVVGDRTTYTNGPCGPIRIASDIDNDGSIERVDTLTYTSTGMTRETVLVPTGGPEDVPDTVATHTYDAALGELQRVETQYDGGPSAHPETVELYTWDGRNQPTRITFDDVWGTHRTIDQAYDGDGRLVERLTTYDGFPANRESATWDCR